MDFSVINSILGTALYYSQRYHRPLNKLRLVYSDGLIMHLTDGRHNIDTYNEEDITPQMYGYINSILLSEYN